MALALSSLAGQGVVDQQISTPWWPGVSTIEQGWGATSYSGEPEGHGFVHWHAGVDLSGPAGSGGGCRTPIYLPSGITEAGIRWVDNPGGYGTALVVELQAVDIWLGHLQSRVAQNGARAGDLLAYSDNTGNSTGCHIHFEVRPSHGEYGSDVDPTRFLEDPSGSGTPDYSLIANSQNLNTDPGDPNGVNPYNGIDPRWIGWELAHQVALSEQRVTRMMIGTAQVGLGSVMMLGGLALAGMGLRGGSMAQAHQSVRRIVKARSQATYQREALTQGLVKRDVAEQGADARSLTRAEEAYRSETVRLYRAGLIGQAEAQRRLGEPVQRVQTRRRMGPNRPARTTGRTRAVYVPGAGDVHPRRGEFLEDALDRAHKQAAAASRIRKAPADLAPDPGGINF